MGVARPSNLAPGPEIAVSDLQQVPGRVVEVERTDAVVPFDLVEDRDCLVRQALLPAFVLLGRGDEAGVDRSSCPVWRGLRLSGREVGFEEKQHCVAHAKRQTPKADGSKAEHFAVEPRQFDVVARLVVEDSLEHAFELHGCTVLRWRAYRDISDELPVFCPECAEREFGVEGASWRERKTPFGSEKPGN
jgi:hypothetical protein